MGIALEIDQDIDPVRVNGSRRIVMRQRANVDKTIERGSKPRAHRAIVVRPVGISQHFESLAIVLLEQFRHQLRCRVLMKIPGQVAETNAFPSGDRLMVKDNLRREAGKRGVEAGRLMFAPVVSQAEHLGRHRHADLFLDTLPCNAHTTASDALWAGLPVLTCGGDTFAGRVAGSLLIATGLPELVTGSLEDYEGTALALARDPQRLRALRNRLENNRGASALFDLPKSTANIEAAYVRMWQTWSSGQEPAAFSIESA